MKRMLAISTIACAIVAVVWAAQSAELWINGKRSTKGLIKQNGETYVPLSDLKAAGAEVTETSGRISIQFKPSGSRIQVDAVEGVIGEYVSNEEWRIKVSGVQITTNPFIGKGTGYKVTFEARNLTNRRTSLHGSGLEAIQLLDKEGRVFVPSGSSFKDRATALAPAGSFRNELVFGDPGASTEGGQPDKILILFRNNGSRKLKNIRIQLASE